MPYYNIELFFPSELFAQNFYHSVKEDTEYSEFDFYYNNKFNVYGNIWDIERYDENEKDLKEDIIKEAISQKIGHIYKLFNYAIKGYHSHFCYVSGNDNKYAGFTFWGGEENEVIFNCLREGNTAGFINLLRWEVSAWLILLKKDLAIKEINREILKKIKVISSDTPLEWIDFIYNAGNLLRGKPADKSYVNRENQRMLFKWKGKKIPSTVMEGLMERGYETVSYGEFMVFTSCDSLPSLWKNYIKHIITPEFFCLNL